MHISTYLLLPHLHFASSGQPIIASSSSPSLPAPPVVENVQVPDFFGLSQQVSGIKIQILLCIPKIGFQAHRNVVFLSDNTPEKG